MRDIPKKNNRHRNRDAAAVAHLSGVSALSRARESAAKQQREVATHSSTGAGGFTAKQREAASARALHSSLALSLSIGWV